VNGETVTVQNGGFVDYFQLLFEQHQIIYAEGIAAESMLVDDRTASLLPETLSKTALQAFLKQGTLPLSGLDVQENLLNRPDAADLLRRASIR
jgi:hypothetical protein